VAGLGGCAACHTSDDGAPYAGGHGIETRWGTFYGTNITPDEAHGIGAWTEEEFARAMRRGRSPDRRLWPAFPFPFFTKMTDGDLSDLWAYLRTLPPVAEPDRPHEIRPGGFARWAWHTFAFSPRPFRPPDGDAVLARGAYLAEAVGHCEGCHTPRNAFGNPSRRHPYAGGEGPPYDSPNITPHADGIEGWSHTDLVWFFDTAVTPDGDVVGSGMGHVIRDGTAKLSAEDREALATFVDSLPAEPSVDGER
jgi:mono/diheme cytochrome c family protein